MSFTEPIFLIFLPVIVLLYRFFPKKARWALLLAASLLFYAWHSVYLLGLLIFSVLVSYGCARSTRKSGGRSWAGPWQRNWVCWQCSNI